MKARLLVLIALLALVPLLVAACTSQESIPAAGQPKDVPAPQSPSPVVPPPAPTPAPVPPSAVPVPPVSTQPMAPEDMQVIAEELVRISDTFLFDGIEESLKLVSVQAGPQPDSWTFTFEFQSRHAGYGDRTDEVLAQVITPHRVVINVEKDEITSAVMDGQWDILAGEA